MEAREPVHALSAYGITWRYARGLLRARVPALAVVVLLSVSIIGLPWAILYGTRWLFIEREVLLGGREAKEARQASAELVRGRTLYTFGASAAINATGVLLGPVIGMLLVLLTDVPLGFINVLSSLVYLALIPFVGIAITLLYYDLRERAEGA
jgi:hypothetical protein